MFSSDSNHIIFESLLKKNGEGGKLVFTSGKYNLRYTSDAKKKKKILKIHNKSNFQKSLNAL